MTTLLTLIGQMSTKMFSVQIVNENSWILSYINGAVGRFLHADN